jgi:hypothetical protein
MTKVQGETAFHCPRCGGLMHKPMGSSLYWHTDHNHPRCEITNILDAGPAAPAPPESPVEPPTRSKPKEKREK